MPRRAFTLVELLVVIAIIGLLSAIAVISLDSSRMQARNVKRIADTKQLIMALYLYYNDNGVYPASSGWKCVSTACTGGWAGIQQSASLNTAMAPYINEPTDPSDSNRSGGGYLYNSTGPGYNSHYDGSTIPAGPTLEYVLEKFVGQCPVGQRYTAAGGVTVECITALQQ